MKALPEAFVQGEQTETSRPRPDVVDPSMLCGGERPDEAEVTEFAFCFHKGTNWVT